MITTVQIYQFFLNTNKNSKFFGYTAEKTYIYQKFINMNYKDLNENDIQKIEQIYSTKTLSWDERMKMICDHIQRSERTARKWLVKLGIKEKKEIDPEQFEKAKKYQIDKEKQNFIITWAQNGTKPHKEFFENIKAYADFRKANIHVIAGRYKNPTSVFTDRDYDTWDDAFAPYLDANRHIINNNLSIMSDVKIQPTAINPMVGMIGFSGQNSCVFGSPKVQFEVIPALNGYEPKRMWTTGACTLSNYTDSKAGKHGEFHHTLGFIIIEVEDDITHVRQVTAAKDGSFNDLFFNVKKQKISRNYTIEGVVLGDIHLGDLDENAFDAALDLLSQLKPKFVVVHDLFNGHSISHHDMKNPIKQYQKELENKNSLAVEIDEMKKWVDNMAKKFNLVIVRSNHDDFVDRWILNSDWKKDIKNAYNYIKYAKILLENMAPKGLIPYIINEQNPNVITLDRDESFKIKDWEVGVHGDYGNNGTRGSLSQFRNLNTKMITAHTHTPARRDGALSVGTMSKLRVGYNQGASSWYHSNVIIHSDGKAQHVNIIKNNSGECVYTTQLKEIKEEKTHVHVRNIQQQEFFCYTGSTM